MTVYHSPEEQARALVARWEHGDEAHRQWLRDVAVPDLVAALTPDVMCVAERAVVDAAVARYLAAQSVIPVEFLRACQAFEDSVRALLRLRSERGASKEE